MTGASPGGGGSGTPLLELRGITKTFPGVVANDAIDLRVGRGEIHAVLGENGAGKSTLMKIIYGFHTPDSGALLLDGVETRFRSPKDSRRTGIGMVFQDFSLIPGFTVLENVALFLSGSWLLLRRDELARRIVRVSAEHGLEVDPHRRVGDLSMGERQRVELTKLLMADARLLVLDEPTSVLAPHEVESLFRVFSSLREADYSVVFITHKVPEALAIADTVTVLRHGRVVRSSPRSEVDANSLVSMMVGADAPAPTRNSAPPSVSQAETVLEFRGVVTGPPDGRGLNGVSFEVRAGEVVGVAGVAGNGQEDLGEALLGLAPPSAGEILLFGESANRLTIAEILQKGVGYIPEDALGLALVPEMRVDENLLLGGLLRSAAGGMWLDGAGIRQRAEAGVAGFPIGLAAHGSRVSRLSGGNIQRVLLARELSPERSKDCRLLVAYYPARGLDVLTAEAARRLLLERRNSGYGIVLVSEDLDELLALSDRLLVMCRGRVVGEFGPDRVSLREIGLLMTGHA